MPLLMTLFSSRVKIHCAQIKCLKIINVSPVIFSLVNVRHHPRLGKLKFNNYAT